MGAGALKSSCSSASVKSSDYVSCQPWPSGAGGFSSVHCVFNRHDQQFYAIKQIPIIYTLSKMPLDNLQNEFHCLQRINSSLTTSSASSLSSSLSSSPFIVRLQSAFHDYKVCSLVLDSFIGGDLRQVLNSQSELSELNLSLIAYCMSSALDHIHNLGILHRDVKPENILLDREGIPFLTDFGISYLQEDPHELLTCCLRSGTVSYLSPEFFSESHRHGTASDYWSLGITLFELAYDTLPSPMIPADDILYANQRNYYIRNSFTPDPLFDEIAGEGGHQDELSRQQHQLKGIMREKSKRFSSEFEKFLCELLDRRIFYRLGGPECFRVFQKHQWILQYESSCLNHIEKRTMTDSEVLSSHFHRSLSTDLISESFHTTSCNLIDFSKSTDTTSYVQFHHERQATLISEYQISSHSPSLSFSLSSSTGGRLRDYFADSLPSPSQSEDIRQSNLFTSEVDHFLRHYSYNSSSSSSPPHPLPDLI